MYFGICYAVYCTHFKPSIWICETESHPPGQSNKSCGLNNKLGRLNCSKTPELTQPFASCV